MNKTIWSYWDNDDEDDNSIVDKCIKSWYNTNSHYKIIILNKDNIHNYIDKFPDNFTNYSIQTKSDFYRIYLLYTYGGVWLDTSIFLNIDLDFFINNKCNKCILFKESYNNTNSVYCCWFIISVYKHNTILKQCLDQAYIFFKYSDKYFIDANSNNKVAYNNWTEWCNNFDSKIEKNFKYIYINTHFWLYLILLLILDIPDNLQQIYTYNALEYGRFHKKDKNNFNEIVLYLKSNNILKNNLIKLGYCERKLICQAIKNKDYNKDSFIELLINY